MSECVSESVPHNTIYGHTWAGKGSVQEDSATTSYIGIYGVFLLFLLFIFYLFFDWPVEARKAAHKMTAPKF